MAPVCKTFANTNYGNEPFKIETAGGGSFKTAIPTRDYAEKKKTKKKQQQLVIILCPDLH